MHTLTDEENQIVEQTDQSAQVTDQATESDDQQTERQQEQEKEASKRKDADYNWSEMRRKTQEHERLIREQQETINRLSAESEPEEQLSKDDLLTVGQYEKLGQRQNESTLREMQRQREEIVRLKYPDIDQVLSQDNIANFEQNEPELTESLMALSGDPLKMKVAAYKLIKKTVKQDTPPSMEKKKAEQNAKKPVSVQSVSKNSAIGNAHLFENGLTPELRKQLNQEMIDSIKHYN